MQLPRTSGILLHPTSIPRPHLGAEAYRFVDWLAAAGQSWWQVLPLQPPDDTGSPYAAPSAFAADASVLAYSGAPVAADEIAPFRARNAYWIDGWDRHVHGITIEGQVRFLREWKELRVYPD